MRGEKKMAEPTSMFATTIAMIAGFWTTVSGIKTLKDTRRDYGGATMIIAAVAGFAVSAIVFAVAQWA